MQADALAELRRTSLFGSARDDQLRPLADRAFTRRLAAGENLFAEGEPSEHLYVVRSGRVRVVVSSPHGDELTLTVLGPGDTFGELSVIDGSPRSATAEALEPSSCSPSGLLRRGRCSSGNRPSCSRRPRSWPPWSAG